MHVNMRELEEKKECLWLNKINVINILAFRLCFLFKINKFFNVYMHRNYSRIKIKHSCNILSGIQIIKVIFKERNIRLF